MYQFSIDVPTAEVFGTK